MSCWRQIKGLRLELQLVHSKINDDSLNKLGLAFERFADLLPEMVYEVDLIRKDTVCQQTGS